MNQPIRVDACAVVRNAPGEGRASSVQPRRCGRLRKGAAAKAVECCTTLDRRHAEPFGETRRALQRCIDAARQHQRVTQRRVALDVGLLRIDQQAAGQRLALPARQVGRVAFARQLQPRFVVAESAQPVALAQQQVAAAQAQMRIVGPAGQRHLEIGQGADPVATRGQQAARADSDGIRRWSIDKASL